MTKRKRLWWRKLLRGPLYPFRVRKATYGNGDIKFYVERHGWQDYGGWYSITSYPTLEEALALIDSHKRAEQNSAVVEEEIMQ